MGFSLWDVFTIPFKHPEILKDNLGDALSTGGKAVGGLVTGDSYFPDNPKRQHRAEDLATDCQTMTGELALMAPKIKQQLAKLSQDIAKVTKDLNLPKNDLTVKSHKFGNYSIEAAGLVGSLLVGYGVSTALTTAATSYLLGSGEIGAAALVDLVGLPAAFSVGVGAAAAGAAIVVVFAVGAIEGAKKRSELQDTIRDGVKARFKLEKAQLVCKRLSSMIASIQQAVDGLMAAKIAGKPNKKLQKGIDELRHRIVHCKGKVEAEISNVDVAIHLAAKDKLRWSWTHEDPVMATKKDLKKALSDSYWDYHWRGKKFRIHFASSGKMDLLKSWKNAKWRVKSVDTAEIYTANGKSSMVLKFQSTDMFLNADWDGTQSSGELVGK